MARFGSWPPRSSNRALGIASAIRIRPWWPSWANVAIAAEGSPADCVLAGLHDVMKDAPPDLVLSGVNRGNNSAENTRLFRHNRRRDGGGVAGCTRDCFVAILSARATWDLADPFEAAAYDFGTDVVRKYIWRPTPRIRADYRLFYNVNFPPVPADEVLGVQHLCRKGFQTRDTRFIRLSRTDITFGSAVFCGSGVGRRTNRPNRAPMRRPIWPDISRSRRCGRI